MEDAVLTEEDARLRVLAYQIMDTFQCSLSDALRMARDQLDSMELLENDEA